MSQAHSISTHRRYGLARVCDVWGVSRATVCRHRVSGNTANEARPPRRRGPEGACSDSALLQHIRAIIEASPFSGEGYRKIWARLRAHGVRTAARRVCVGSCGSITFSRHNGPSRRTRIPMTGRSLPTGSIRSGART